MSDTWTAISGYTSQDYTDTAVFEVNSDTKKIALITGQALVAGEENSQYIKFVLDRYWDGIDIKDKAFYVEYALAGTYYGKTAAVNAEYTTEQVRFGWIVPKEACCISGTLLFILRIESEDYVLKTQIAEHHVFKSVNVEDVVPEPTKEAWYRDFAARVEVAIDEAEAALTQAQQAVMRAEAAAQNAQTSENNAEAAAAEAQIRYGSPLTASEAALMVEENRVYVYTGSESGYTFGNWYYYDGTAWVSGGVYNGSGVNTDTTLTQSGMPADAKAIGDEISQIKEDFTDYVFDEKYWSSLALTSSTGAIGKTTNERVILTIPLPRFITEIQCPSVSSALFAYDNGVYVGVWNNVSFEKTFFSFNKLFMQPIFEAYPSYDMYLVVYAYPENVNQYITFKALAWEGLRKHIANSKVNTLERYVESYYNAAQATDNKLIYASGVGLYAENVSLDNVDGIQCSELVYAALRKTLYSESRYAKTRNFENPNYWETDGSVSDLNYCPSPYILPDYLLADNLAKYFDGKGRLIKFDKNHTDIMPGDIIFQGYAVDGSRYKNITHAAIVLSYQRYQNQILVVDGSNGTKLDGSESGVNYSKLTPNAHTYYSHVDIVTEQNESLLIASRKINSITVNPDASGSTQVAILIGGKHLKGFFTVFVEADNADDVIFSAVYEYTNNGTATRISYYGTDVNSIIPIALPETTGRDTCIKINVRNKSNATVTVTNIKAEIYTGMHDCKPI